jgi:hypothetical protein
MSIPTYCTQHGRTVWMAYCPACTAWHLAVEIARRDGLGPTPGPEHPTSLRPARTRRLGPENETPTTR